MLSVLKLTIMNFKRFLTFITVYLVLFMSYIIITTFVHYLSYKDMVDTNNDKISKYITSNKLCNDIGGINRDFICDEIRCTKIVEASEYVPDILLLNITSDFNMVYPVGNLVYLVNIEELIEYQHELIVNFTIAFTVFYVIFYTLYVVYRNKEELGKEFYRKKVTEVKLQTELTESLHHELGIPVALIDTLLTDLYTKMYMNGTGRMFSLSEIPSLKLESRREVDKIAFEHYENITTATDRIKAILKLISNNKHIKYNNGTVSLYKIFSNICNSVNGFRITKFTPVFINQDLMEKYATGRGLDNGLHMNIINIMITNSLEAGADTITFKVEYLNEKFIMLYITDNGNGIRDKKNNITTSNEIFNYGYTIKEQDDSCTKDSRFISKILNLMLRKGKRRYETTRGVGLSLVKNILTKANGYVKIFETSPKGTTFQIKLPIKPRLDKHID